MHEHDYEKVVVAGKRFMKDPLTLLNMPVSSDAIYGYTMPDEVFLSKQWAKESGGFYFDAIDFLDAVHLNDTKRIEAYKQQLRDKEKIITSRIAFGTNDECTQLAGYWLPLFTELKDVWKDPSLKERRLVVPVQLLFGDLVSHASVACFNFKPKDDAVDVILLEQHAQKEGEPDYEANLDYSKGIDLHARALGQVMRMEQNGWLGIKNVRIGVNATPICRRHNVCGVVATEIARRLLEVKDPVDLLLGKVVITNEEVDKLHERNQKLVLASNTLQNTMPSDGRI